jgi:uncharacterized small protein (DUF1192 family)
MPDGPDQQQQTQPSAPQQQPSAGGLNWPVQDTTPQQQQAPTPPPQPNPQQVAQQADLAHHAFIGKAVSALMGNQVNYQVDPRTGQTVAVPQKQTPGQWGRSMVLGAMLGLAAGSSGDAKGGSVGGFLGGLGRGGAAVMQHDEQQDNQRMDRAQQQYKNQLEAQKNQRDQQQADREQQGFQTEQQLKQASIAAQNMATLHMEQLIHGETWDQFQKEADAGKAKTDPYVVAGIQPVATGVTQEQQHAIMQQNPSVVHWDWEPTGIKTVMGPDGKSTYEHTYDAYDTDKKVTVTPDFLNLLKKEKIDDYYPGTTTKLKEGQQLTPREFSALKGEYQQVHNQNLEQQKGQLSVQEMQERVEVAKADILKLRAEAAKQAKSDKQAKLMGDSLDEWTTTLNKLQKTNPNANEADAFNQLTPKSKFEISTGLVKTIDSLEKQIRDASQQFPPDQDRMNELKEQQEAYRALQRRTIGDVQLPKAPQQGAPIPDDVYAQYLKKFNGDTAQAKNAASGSGWGPPAPAQQPASQQQTAPSEEPIPAPPL